MIGANDDFGSLNSFMQLNLSIWQRYIVVVGDFGNNSAGDVAVSISSTASSALTVLTPDTFGNVSTNGLVDANGDIDFFRIIAPADASGALSLSLIASAGLSPRMVLWGPGGVPLTTGSSVINYNSIVPNAEYRVSVFSNSFASSGAYTLNVDYADNVAVVTTTSNGGAGSLRQAILDVNSHANEGGVADRIRFAIPGGGVKTISLTSALPPLTDRVEILGNLQPGFSGTPLIVLNGAGLQGPGATADGLQILPSAAGSTVRSLAIRGFPGDAIEITSPNNFVIANELGSNLNGVSISTIAATGNSINGNRIGVRFSGAAQPNLGRGIQIANSSNNIIVSNVIANNAIGVRVSTSEGNRISQNSMFNNSAIGIDLQPNTGVTANDTLDVDEGANRLQNYATLVGTPKKFGDNLKVQFRVDTNPANASYPLTVEFYVADPVGNRQGQVYLGSANYGVASYPGNRVVTLVGAAAGLIPGVDKINVLVRDAAGNTSEYSGTKNLGGAAILPEDDPAFIDDGDEAFSQAPAVEQNGFAIDVNDDGTLSPLDALLVVNALRSKAVGEGEYLSLGTYYDTNGDGQLSPVDALLVINALNDRQSAAPVELKEYEVWDEVLIDLTADLKLKNALKQS